MRAYAWAEPPVIRAAARVLVGDVFEDMCRGTPPRERECRPVFNGTTARVMRG